MSVKDIKNYYNMVCEQRQEMLNEIKDFEEEAKNSLIEPERLDAIKKTIQPLMDNYERWSYMMYLLNKPTKKKKYKSYIKSNRKFISNLNTKNSIESTIEENNQVINKLKEI